MSSALSGWQTEYREGGTPLDRYLLKNIIIVILVLANGFLLGSFITRELSASRVQRQTEEQLTALFAADNITLEEGAISLKNPPTACTLSRDIQREQAAATFFLGKGVLREDQGGGTYTYSSEIGVARFRANGSFDIVGSLCSQDVEALCRSFCKAFSYDAPVFSETTEETGSIGVAICRHNNLPVFNCTITFTVDHGTLLTVSGTLLPEESSAQPAEREPLSASAALTAFQQMRRESFAVASAVTETYPCYELQGSTASALSLIPTWCVVTDASNYYVNCHTGIVTTR